MAAGAFEPVPRAWALPGSAPKSPTAGVPAWLALVVVGTAAAAEAAVPVGSEFKLEPEAGVGVAGLAAGPLAAGRTAGTA